jgi:hypothetical protein
MNASFLLIEGAKAQAESAADTIELPAPDLVLRAQLGIAAVDPAPGLELFDLGRGVSALGFRLDDQCLLNGYGRASSKSRESTLSQRR